MTSSNENIFRVTGHLCGEFPTQKPVTRSFAVFFDLHPNKRLSKQWWGWWYETPPCPLRHHRNVGTQLTWSLMTIYLKLNRSCANCSSRGNQCFPGEFANMKSEVDRSVDGKTKWMVDPTEARSEFQEYWEPQIKRTKICIETRKISL